MAAKNNAEKKRSVRLNIIDFLIIIVLLGAVAGIALRSGIVKKVQLENSMEKARVTFMIQDIADTSYDYIRIGDQFMSTSHFCLFGTLESKQTFPAEAYINNEKGEMIRTFSENHRIDVRGTFLVEGTFTDEGFLLGGTNHIAPGAAVSLQSSDFAVTITVMEIEKAEK